MLHHKGDGIATFAAAEVFENSLARNHEERGRFFVREWTECLVILPGFFKGHKIADYIDNIEAVSDFFYGVAGDQRANSLTRKDTLVKLNNQEIKGCGLWVFNSIFLGCKGLKTPV